MLPNIASENIQDTFIAACSKLRVTPRQAVLLAHIWLARDEHDLRNISDSMLNILDFSPDVLPCGGQCPMHKIIVNPVEK